MEQVVIGIPCDIKLIGAHPYHAAGDKYIDAARGGAGGSVLLIPALGDASLAPELLDMFDGILLTGSLSNVEPRHYGGDPSRPGTLHDPERDRTTLPLVRHVLAAGIPLLGICRGLQEINVALGGELYQHVHEAPGMNDHREPASTELETLYGPSHTVRFCPEGALQRWTGCGSAIVNSLHHQGIKRLADGLKAEATAEDGLVEAFSVTDSPAFAFAVQWHPEWHYADNPVSMAILRAFGDACRERQARRAASARFVGE
ncbi:gamma-glutamyl-gamma-aminobutyrate hydrolase family protein [Paludibacterium yongneupense]|uniref:gamma-glutamyl-gamma-aminobutyrate hydrolase family protein n=1 Tax=Paludibacterium yongneupense TaxID=400061 RepID=UPI00040A59AE|nr:gamma-glutamyl-gamma-aminobutyrate hydrolase family protein [Paludibacterium yongneupense]